MIIRDLKDYINRYNIPDDCEIRCIATGIRHSIGTNMIMLYNKDKNLLELSLENILNSEDKIL